MLKISLTQDSVTRKHCTKLSDTIRQSYNYQQDSVYVVQIIVVCQNIANVRVI